MSDGARHDPELHDPELVARWRSVVTDAGLGPRPAADAALDGLLARYGGPRRRYHAVGHLRAVLRTLDELVAPDGATASARLAAWYHDAVYDPTVPAGDNEARSAELARRSLADLGAPPALVDDVAALVVATAAHRLDGLAVVQADAFLDADLAVLGAAAADYDRYAAAIRQEYAHVAEADYRAGRAAVLERFAARPQLYFSAAGRARFEAAARANLARELAALRGPAPR